MAKFYMLAIASEYGVWSIQHISFLLSFCLFYSRQTSLTLEVSKRSSIFVSMDNQCSVKRESHGIIRMRVVFNKLLASGQICMRKGVRSVTSAVTCRSRPFAVD